MMLPGRTIIASLSDGSSVQGVTLWSWSWLRMRDVRSSPAASEPDVIGTLLIPPASLISVQVIPRKDR